MIKYTEVGNGKMWLFFGFTKQIALGFNINTYSVNVDLGPFYLGVEW